MEELQKFDFNEHVTATILFDDSDDEIMDVKPIIKEIAQKENNLTAAQEPKVVKEKPKPSLPIMNSTKALTVKPVSKNLGKLQQPLDMPILEEEENISSDYLNNTSNISVKNSNKNEKGNTDDNGKNKRKIHIVNEEIIQLSVSAFFNHSNKCTDTDKQNTPIQSVDNNEVLNEILSNNTDKALSITSVNYNMTPNRKQIKEPRKPSDKAKKNINSFNENKSIPHSILNDLLNDENRLHTKFAIANDELSKRRKTSGGTSSTFFSGLNKNCSDIDKESQKKDYLPTENGYVPHKNLNNNDCDTQNKINIPSENRDVSKTTPLHGIMNKILKSVELKSHNHNINDELNSAYTHKKKINSSSNVTCNQSSCNAGKSLIESRKDKTQRSHAEFIENNPTSKSANEQQPIIEPFEPCNRNTMSQKFNKNNIALSNYVMELLDTVSEHIISIINSYESYVKLHYSKSDLRLKEIAKNNYIRTKNHFFDLSYSSVLNIIIPRNNDPEFEKRFLANTIEIAKSKSKNVTYKQIAPLYLDMIKWVQKRQIQIQNMNINSTTHPLLTQELLRPPNIYPDSPIQKQSTVTSNNTKKSNVPTENFRESSTSHQEQRLYQVRPHNIMQPLQNPIQLSKPPPYQNYSQRLTEIRQSPQDYNFQSSGQNFTIQSRFTNQPDPQRRYYENHLQSRTYPMQNTNHIIINGTNHIGQDLQQKTRDVNIQETAMNLAPHWQQTSTKQINHHSYNWHNYYMPSSTVQSFQPNHQEMNSSQNNQHVRPEIPIQAETNRSSISRDSGFMSPLNFNASSDVSLQEEQRSQTTATPVITHVTSLNPQATLIADGACVICRKITKQKCLGCFKLYYCSHDCQLLDWKYHQFVCK